MGHVEIPQPFLPYEKKPDSEANYQEVHLFAQRIIRTRVPSFPEAERRFGVKLSPPRE
jgi:hypothetical protein